MFSFLLLIQTAYWVSNAVVSWNHINTIQLGVHSQNLNTFPILTPSTRSLKIVFHLDIKSLICHKKNVENNIPDYWYFHGTNCIKKFISFFSLGNSYVVSIPVFNELLHWKTSIKVFKNCEREPECWKRNKSRKRWKG